MIRGIAEGKRGSARRVGAALDMWEQHVERENRSRDNDDQMTEMEGKRRGTAYRQSAQP